MRFLILLLVLYAALTALVYLFQRGLMYFPDRQLDPPQQYGLDMQSVRLEAGDGIGLTAWYQEPRGDRSVIVFFQGNAGHLGYRRDKFLAFLDAGYGLLALSYRGYGDSEGRIHEQGFYRDARAVANWLENQGVGTEQLVLYGESLGTGVATWLALQVRPRAVVLEAPYTSVADRAGEIYWFLPARWLVRDRFDNLSRIDRIDAPVLILAGEQDEVIPVAHGQRLFEAAPEPKAFVRFPGHGHNDLDPGEITRALTEFLTRQQAVKQSR